MAVTVDQLALRVNEQDVIDTARAQHILSRATALVVNYVGTALAQHPVTEGVIEEVAARVYINWGGTTSDASGPSSLGFSEAAANGMVILPLEKAQLDRIRASSSSNLLSPFFALGTFRGV